MVQLFMTQFVEIKRWQDMREPKSQGEKGSFFGLEAAIAGSGETGKEGLLMTFTRSIGKLGSNLGSLGDERYAYFPLVVGPG